MPWARRASVAGVSSAPADNCCVSGLASAHGVDSRARWVKPEKLLERLAAGSFHNVAFADLCRLAEALGFRFDRVRGSHQIYVHPRAPGRINLQDRKGKAKPYQIW